MMDLERLDEALEDVDEIYSYVKGDYFDEKWGLGEKAERVKGLLRAYRDLLANGERVEWCRVHAGNPRDCERKVVYDEMCDVVPALVDPDTEGATGE